MAKSLKHWGATLALVSTALLTVGGAHAQGKVLNIYNWSDYIADDTIKNLSLIHI
jgi:putrescine transport system substrate-binding protein